MMFQSSPAPKGGRYSYCFVTVFLRNTVSILARPEGRALHECARARERVKYVFQSSPAPKGGRYRVPAASILDFSRFQSSPAPKGGRYPHLHIAINRVHPVSILARPEGRALPDN